MDRIFQTIPGVEGAELLAEEELSIMIVGVCGSVYWIIGISLRDREVPIFGAQFS
jgi:hypothetical protein